MRGKNFEFHSIIVFAMGNSRYFPTFFECQCYQHSWQSWLLIPTYLFAQNHSYPTIVYTVRGSCKPVKVNNLSTHSYFWKSKLETIVKCGTTQIK